MKSCKDMRQLRRRNTLPIEVEKRLQKRTASLMTAPDPKIVCEQRFDNARKCDWFITIRSRLVEMAGETRTCMFCDHNEPTDVEHFKPKSVFPGDTFRWENMLWICTTCNRLKGNFFPPVNCDGAELINPSLDSVWNYFLLDEFGNLIMRWDSDANDFNSRAKSTCKYIQLDREEVQTRRMKRMKGLKSLAKQAVSDLRSGICTVEDINVRVSEWMAEPFQADVADYCLRGPGTSIPPFSEILGLGVVVPAE